MNEADVKFLAGQRFLAKSSNTCRIEEIGPGAIRLVWRWGPSEEDQDEFSQWLQLKIGPVSITKSVGMENEAHAYEDWKKR